MENSELKKHFTNILEFFESENFGSICVAIYEYCRLLDPDKNYCDNTWIYLDEYFHSIPRPKKRFFDFFNKDKILKAERSLCYWEFCLKAPRIKFLKKIIKGL